MALQIDYATDFGFTAPDAYVRLAEFNVNKYEVRGRVDVYVTELARREDKQPLTSMPFNVGMEQVTGDIFPAVYTLLKQDERFTGAIDV